jgi:hypothetical protein
MEGHGLLARLTAVADKAAGVVAGTELAAEVAAVEARIRRPLRVAIAGRTKAGKSTLLNALVGERLAATDATECTRIVTWYRYDLGYMVEAVLRTGERRNLEFDRSEGLEIRLGDLSLAEIDRLEVGWPSSRLADLTLIDTPGLDAGGSDGSQRTLAALVGDDGEVGDADAVVYLMRHLHRQDVEFLEAFDAADRAATSPVNAVALLSRADEIGAGRLDAMASAAQVAQRYAADPRVSNLAMTVLPVAGLIAETGASLRESEVAGLRDVAALDQARLDLLLLSVDRFRMRDDNPLLPEVRDRLLARLGLFGLRLAIAAIRERPASTASELSRVETSGIRAVEQLLRRHFADRADALKTSSALLRLRRLADRAAAAGLTGALDLVATVERAEASWPELAQLRLLHLVYTRTAQLQDEERAEVDRLFTSGDLAARLGLPAGAESPEIRAAALDSIDRWRRRAGSPLADRRTAEAAEGVARMYEGLYASLVSAARS